MAVIFAALSSFRNRPLPRDVVVFGELGLAGEIRPVQGGEDRLREAAKQGFKRAIIPKQNAPRNGVKLGIEVHAVERLQHALDVWPT